MTVRAILFDLGDTLFQLNPMAEVQEDLAEVLVRIAGVSAEAARLACERALLSHREEAMAAWRSGRTEEPPLDQVLARHFSAHLPLDAESASLLAAVFWRADVARFNPGPDCSSRVARFRAQGYRLAAVSNTSTHAAFLDDYLKSVGLLPLFETVVYSSDVGVRKPHPEIYREALHRLALEPHEAVFVGDRVREDVLGPQSVGLAAVLTHEFRQEDPGEARPLAVIGCLGDLSDVLGPPR
jgi:putative hydrolase of the HAD superfamily